ncbi:sigma 54-interacting transcriptional regulator, partial [Myxococcota bacterium]|nr:sigma 54-interacting transcriptional regulator [Myxococcota bacterium]
MTNAKSSELMDISTQTILESISEGVITSDTRHRVVYMNRAAERILGIKREEAVGKRCSDVFQTSLCEEECVLLASFTSGEPVTNRSAYLNTLNGDKIPVMISAAPITNDLGDVVGGVETFRDVSILENLRKELTGTVQIGDMVTRNPQMKTILDVLPQMATSPSSVLIQGATGTGKEILARAIHHLSLRHNRPFVAVNCGALPDTLLESELFGYEAGAFTGANKAKPGRFTLAEGGTLFLDEIGEISPSFQVKLLRVLQERTFEPLGSVKTLHSDVRIIVATNKNLMQEVRRGTFRDDLFYRLNVIQIDLPPLRKRKEDIPLLIDHFIKRFNTIQKKNVTGISTEA